MKKPPLKEKGLFSPEEAARFYGLSRAKLRRLLECGEQLPFLLFYRKRKLIVRSKFETYMKRNPHLREALKKGEWRGNHGRTQADPDGSTYEEGRV